MRLSAAERRLLLSLTSLPTAAGREHAVQRAVDLWAASLGDAVRVRRDDVGNALITRSTTGRMQRRAGRARPRAASTLPPEILITAHLDHPAFVVRRVVSSREFELEFRGGVHDAYFNGAALELFDTEGRPHPARLAALDATAQPFKLVRAVLRGAAPSIRAGCIGRWALPRADIRGGMLHTHACDDLAAAAAAMITFERLIQAGRGERVGLLFTVAEEVGFLGAIRAARSGIIPRGATLLCLENSRSFPNDSPIGAGAILRVGDRLSVFSPKVTNALTQLYQRHAATDPRFRWQRKLMPGGACEATAFASLGHESTCLCLPLGNYHNMCAIDDVLAGRRRAVIGREFVAIADIESLINMLMLAADALPAPGRSHGAAGSRSGRGGSRVGAGTLGEAELGDFRPMMEKLWRERSKLVLGEVSA